MTREEAKEILENAHFFGRSQNDIDTALDMAIKALEQEPCEELDFVQPHKKMSVNLEVCKMREATQEEREGVKRYIDSIAKDVPDNNVGEYINREDVLMCLTGEWTELTDEVIHKFIKRIRNLPLMVLPRPTECEDCISRQAVLDAFWKLNVELRPSAIDAITNMIKDLSPVTPAEKVGHWIMHIDDLFPAESTMECNKCHEHQPITIDDNYCPSCGAKMASPTGSEGSEK